MPLHISPHFTTDHFVEPLSVDEKVALFADRVRGWQLDIAQSLGQHPHSGFAVLAIVSSYFEMIAEHEAGYTGVSGASKFHFQIGAKSVLEPLIDPPDTPIPDQLLDLLYDEVRCGMYHGGITGSRIRLNDTLGIPVVTMDSDGGMTVDPHQLVLVLQNHFSRYVTRLLDAENDVLRAKFEDRFDSGTAGKQLGTSEPAL